MTMSLFGKLKPPSNGNKTFVKIEPDTKVRGLIVGEPIEVIREIKGEKRWKFRVNFVIQENGAFVAKILEQGASISNQLKALEEDGWDLSKNVIVISRKGSGMKTEYTVTPDPKGALTPSALEKIAAVQLHDLELKEQATETVGADADENAPF
jgi:hypothetical protein